MNSDAKHFIVVNHEVYIFWGLLCHNVMLGPQVSTPSWLPLCKRWANLSILCYIKTFKTAPRSSATASVAQSSASGLSKGLSTQHLSMRIWPPLNMRKASAGICAGFPCQDTWTCFVKQQSTSIATRIRQICVRWLQTQGICKAGLQEGLNDARSGLVRCVWQQVDMLENPFTACKQWVWFNMVQLLLNFLGWKMSPGCGYGWRMCIISCQQTCNLSWSTFCRIHWWSA